MFRRPETEEARWAAVLRDHRGAGRIERIRRAAASVQGVSGADREIEAQKRWGERRCADHGVAGCVERDRDERRILKLARRDIEGVAEDVVDTERVLRVPRAGYAVRGGPFGVGVCGVCEFDVIDVERVTVNPLDGNVSGARREGGRVLQPPMAG